MENDKNYTDTITDKAPRLIRKVKDFGNSGHVTIPHDLAEPGDKVLIVKIPDAD